MAEPYSKCACQQCGGHIEFPTSWAGQTIACPHCNRSTLLAAKTARAKSKPAAPLPAPKRSPTPWIIALALIGLSLSGFYWFKVRRVVATPSIPPTAQGVAPLTTSAPVVVVPQPPPDPWHGLVAGPVKLETAKDSTLIYATGVLRNESDRQRFGVKVELEVFNAADRKLGTATDYTSSIDPGKEWKFRALVVDRLAKSAKLKAVTED